MQSWTLAMFFGGGDAGGGGWGSGEDARELWLI